MSQAELPYTAKAGGAGFNLGRGDESSLAQAPQDLLLLHQLCREGRLYDVERWIDAGRPLQLAESAIPKGRRPRTALQIALKTGQHSLVFLLLRSGYRLELERYGPLDVVLQSRRWDLFELLLESGGDLKGADVYTVLNTYNVELYERCWAEGYDLTERHEMASSLGHGTTNRPLLGFVKRHRREDPKIQKELNIALGYHVKAGNERGVNLCLWAGADPHAPAPEPELGYSEESVSEDGEEHFVGWSAVEGAAIAGHLTILKRLGPDPDRDDFDNLYRYTKHETIITFLCSIRPPKDLTTILCSQLWWVGNRVAWTGHRGIGPVETLFSCGVTWEERNPERLTALRRALLKLGDDDLKRIVSRLRRPETCAPATYQELVRTPRIQRRMLALGLVKKPIYERDRRRDEIARMMSRYDRVALYEQVWSQPVQDIAKSYGISGVRLGKVCRKLSIPVPPRGYWARVQSGQMVRRPSLPKAEWSRLSEAVE